MEASRIALSLALSALAGGVAYRQRWLTAGGWAGAILVGTATAGFGGWDWGLLVIIFFVSSSALGRLGRGAKERLAAIVWEKGGRRDLVQVAANGGAVSVLAVLSALVPWPGWWAAALGALATATADTWATEIGVLSRRRPRLITSGRPVPAGTSGGVTLLGSTAALAGAALIGGSAVVLQALFGRPPELGALGAALVGGLAGVAADSLLGATLQARYRCPRCDVETERRRHSCGKTTRYVSGIPWLNNDAVNALACAAGGLVALLAGS